MIIVALDVADRDAALKVVDLLGGHVDFYKVGLQLFTAAGPGIVASLKDRGKRVFLDLKFHDIPNTVAGAVRSAGALGVEMLTVHATGGTDMLAAATDAARSAERPPLVLAVTVLTSMDETTLRQTGVTASPQEQVLHLATLARSAGCNGLVCSAHELQTLRSRVGRDMKMVIPGIRPADSAKGDQARVATPREAVQLGADYLVIGRPVTAAPDPVAVVQQIRREIES